MSCRPVVLALLTTLLSACEQVSPSPPPAWPVAERSAHNLTAACVPPGTDGDLFPDKVAFAYSSQLSVSYHGHYKLLTFTPGVNTGDIQRFAFVQCGAATPTDLPPHTRIVPVPIKSLATSHDSMLGALADLNAVEVLVGLPNRRAVTVPAVKQHLESGKVFEIYGHGHSTIEPVIALAPEVYLTFYSAYPEYNLHPTLWRLGVQALPQSDHLEATALGRAEWLKFLALMLNREAEANAVFAGIERDYLALREIAAKASTRPRVLTGMTSGRDVWETTGGGNFRAALLHDAGGQYAITSDMTAGSWRLMPFEQVYAEAGDAPYWHGGFSGIADYTALLDTNPLYGWLTAVRQRQVSTIDRGYLGAWAYPAHDQGMTRPQWLLKDAIRVLHPDLLPPGAFHFTRTLQ